MTHCCPVENHGEVLCQFDFRPEEELSGWAENEEADRHTFESVTACYDYATPPPPPPAAAAAAAVDCSRQSRSARPPDRASGGPAGRTRREGSSPDRTSPRRMVCSAPTSRRPQGRLARSATAADHQCPAASRCPVGKTVRQVMEEMSAAAGRPDAEADERAAEGCKYCFALPARGRQSASGECKAMSPVPTNKAASLLLDKPPPSSSAHNPTYGLCTTMVQVLRQARGTSCFDEVDDSGDDASLDELCVMSRPGTSASKPSRAPGAAAARPPPPPSSLPCSGDAPAAPPYLPSLPSPQPLNRSFALQSCSWPTQHLLAVLAEQQQQHCLRFVNGSVLLLSPSPSSSHPGGAGAGTQQTADRQQQQQRANPAHRVPVVTFSANTMRSGPKPSVDLRVSGTAKGGGGSGGVDLKPKAPPTAATPAAAAADAADAKKKPKQPARRPESAYSTTSLSRTANLVRRIRGIGASHILTSAGKLGPAAPSPSPGDGGARGDAAGWDANSLGAGDALTTRAFHVGLNRLQSARACT